MRNYYICVGEVQKTGRLTLSSYEKQYFRKFFEEAMDSGLVATEVSRVIAKAYEHAGYNIDPRAIAMKWHRMKNEEYKTQTQADAYQYSQPLPSAETPVYSVEGVSNEWFVYKTTIVNHVGTPYLLKEAINQTPLTHAQAVCKARAEQECYQKQGS